ncbi:MAG: DUF1330 domain-containing protein [Bacteroidota bacterium]
MNLINQVAPTKEEFVDFIKNYPSNTPLVMVNILKFKDQTEDGKETGRQAYKRYSKNMEPLVAKAGGKMIWGGNVERTVIGDYAAQPDMFLIVSYPSKEAFIAMSTTPEYEEIAKDRKKALEYGALLSTTQLG